MEKKAPSVSVVIVYMNKESTTSVTPINGKELDGTLKSLIVSLKDVQENCNVFLSSLVENKGHGNTRSKHAVADQKDIEEDFDDFDDDIYSALIRQNKRKSPLSQMPLKPKKIC